MILIKTHNVTSKSGLVDGPLGGCMKEVEFLVYFLFFNYNLVSVLEVGSESENTVCANLCVVYPCYKSTCDRHSQQQE